MSDEGFELTNRGFRQYAPIRTRYGHELKVYESSGAEEAQLWLGVSVEHSVLELEEHDLSVLLTFEQAKALRKTLKRAMKEHYQVRP